MFKKWSVAALAVLIVSGVSASENWTIENFDVVAAIQSDGSVDIVETIEADFSNEPGKHGIFRTIPFQHEDGYQQFTTPLRVIGVADETGRTRPYKITTESDSQKIRIGDPNKTVGSREVYQIEYTVEGALMRFDEYDEFFWNVTGHDWPVSIEASSLTVSLPDDSGQFRMKCFTGALGSKLKNCVAAEVNGRTVKFETTEMLLRGEGWTAVLGFDRELVTVADRDYAPLIRMRDMRNGVLFLAPFGLLVWLWHKRKKRLDFLRVDHPIIPRYEAPAGLLPAGVGTLRDGRLDARDMTAAIISLAVRGYLTISETKSGLLGLTRDHVLTRTKKTTEKLEEFDRVLVAVLFGTGTHIRFSDLKNSFYLSVPELISAVEAKLQNGGLFRTHKITLIVETILVESLFFVGIALEILGVQHVVWAYLIVGVLGNILLRMFPAKKTVRGAEVAHHIKCYREFLMTAEEDRLKWAEKQSIFEENLPYAIALGVADIWAKRFVDLARIPDWYDGGSDFRMHQFGSRIDGLSHDFHDTAMTAPKSSGSSFSSGSSGFGGGGFSGGGGGGGGGGSW